MISNLNFPKVAKFHIELEYFDNNGLPFIFKSAAGASLSMGFLASLVAMDDNLCVIWG